MRGNLGHTRETRKKERPPGPHSLEAQVSGAHAVSRSAPSEGNPKTCLWVNSTRKGRSGQVTAAGAGAVGCMRLGCRQVSHSGTQRRCRRRAERRALGRPRARACACLRLRLRQAGCAQASETCACAEALGRPNEAHQPATALPAWELHVPLTSPAAAPQCPSTEPTGPGFFGPDSPVLLPGCRETTCGKDGGAGGPPAPRGVRAWTVPPPALRKNPPRDRPGWTCERHVTHADAEVNHGTPSRGTL